MEIGAIYVSTNPAADYSEIVLIRYMLACTFFSALMVHELCLIVHDTKKRRVAKRVVLLCVCSILEIVHTTASGISLRRGLDEKIGGDFCSEFYPPFDKLVLSAIICAGIVWLQCMISVAMCPTGC